MDCVLVVDQVDPETDIMYDQTELAITSHYYMSSFSIGYYYHGATHI
jgi:hypothetical protein